MKKLAIAALASLAALLATPARAEAPPATGADADCQGELSGAVTATFNCTVKAVVAKDGKVTFTVKPNAKVKGLKEFGPITFSIPSPITAQTYTHRDLAGASAAAVTADGKKYAASAELADRGDIEVQVVSTMRTKGQKALIGMLKAHAHLVPADTADKSEIQFTVDMLTRW